MLTSSFLQDSPFKLMKNFRISGKMKLLFLCLTILGSLVASAQEKPAGADTAIAGVVRPRKIVTTMRQPRRWRHNLHAFCGVAAFGASE